MLTLNLHFPFLLGKLQSHFPVIHLATTLFNTTLHLFIHSFFQVTDQMEVIFDEEGFYLDSSVTLESGLEEFPYEEVFNAVSIKLRRLYIPLAMYW